MSRVVVVEYTSIDGVIQAPGHAGEDPDGFDKGGWTQPYFADHRRYMPEIMQRAGGFLFGRTTYEIFAAYWPTVSGTDDVIAAALNELPKFVVSTTLESPSWANTTILGTAPAAVRDLKASFEGDLVVIGSSKLAQSLLDASLVDEYQLWLHPVVLGTGKKLFRDGGPAISMKLTGSRTTEAGLVLLTYEPLYANAEGRTASGSAEPSSRSGGSGRLV